MDTKIMCQQLPRKGPEAVLRDTLKKHIDQLGGEITVFKRVHITVAPKITDMVITPEIQEEYETRKKAVYAAECCCTVCNEVYYTDWITEGRHKGIGLIEGEDGLTYPSLDDYDPGVGTYIHLSSGDGFLCPYCSAVTTLKHKSAIGGGRTWQLLISSVENIGIYTTIFYWLVLRSIDADGNVFSGIYPWQAYVIDEGGRLRRFIYNRNDLAWRYSTSGGDALFSKYPSMDGDLYNYRIGGWGYDICPSLIGCTGEKTGLYAYVNAGGNMPVSYLKTWRRHRTVENLANNGWSALIEGYLETETSGQTHDIPYAIMPGVFFGGKKPHEMLHMDKVSFRQLRSRRPDGWSLTQYEAWLKYKDTGGGANALMFDEYYNSFTLSGVNVLMELRGINPDIDFPKVHSYLTKQKLQPTDAGLLLDTWRMTMRLFGRRTLTSEEMWPRNLFGIHERLSRQQRLEQSKDDWTKYLAGFMEVRERLRDLEWTDGELCVVLPKDNGDLIREGDVLRHCVSGYGESHISGRDTIFFIRKYRRPERSYYTLDINMLGKPVRNQLHGYGNERHGPNKEYHHKIPEKVLAFCERWEKEILMPWYHEQMKQKKAQEKTAARKEAKTA